MPLTMSLQQAQWVSDNILWILPTSAFIFTSLVIGFWKVVGKLFCKKKAPQENLDMSEKNSMPNSSFVSTSQAPVGEYEYKPGDYLTIKQWAKLVAKAGDEDVK